MIAVAVAVAVSAAGCTALTPSDTVGTGPAPATPAEDSLASSCETVNAEWGFALDGWVALDTREQVGGFEQRRAEHEAVISTLQSIANRVDAPEVRAALDATISVHQEYADTIWPGLAAVPEGYPAVLDDPDNLLVVLGTQVSAFEQQMSDADVQRYDLCGLMQSGQTAAQACEVANGDWVDAGVAYNNAANVAGRDVAEGQRQAADGLVQLKAALVQVTEPGAYTEMARMYDAYETFYEDGFSTLLTEEQVAQLSDEEFDAYVAEGDAAFAVWDGALTSGEERLSAYCAGQG